METCYPSDLEIPNNGANFNAKTKIDYPTIPHKRANAELINGLIGMDLNTLNAIGKRSNAELINGLNSWDFNRLSHYGRR
ncbi:Pdf-1 [Aphelenchoides besseyi]|nr:Pdf-1 [Aphelenchoides besseyi]